MSDPKIIVSLDFAGPGPAMALVEQLDPAACRIKIGKELFTRTGPALIEDVQKRGFDVFLDLKYHDIPNTTAAACRAAAELGVWMLNVHVSGGTAMLLAARDAVEQSAHKPLLVGVTVLTSLSQADLEQLGISTPLADHVLKLAGMAQDCGLDGVVCSAREAPMLRKKLGKGFRLITPGIRPAGSDMNDQARTLTPADAIQAGSDYLVVGRPITRAEKPMIVLQSIQEEIDSVKREA